MSVSMNNLFNFSRALPEPFDKLVSKKVKVTSKYGSATEATLSCTMVKAVHAVCNCMVGTGEGAVGTIDHRTVAEYKSSAGPDMYHLVVFDSGSGNIMASIYDNNTETIENYNFPLTMMRYAVSLITGSGGILLSRLKAGTDLKVLPSSRSPTRSLRPMSLGTSAGSWSKTVF